MLPITKANLQRFCHVCLHDISTKSSVLEGSDLEPLNNLSETSTDLISQPICQLCSSKINGFREFQRKSIISTGVLKLINIEESFKVKDQALVFRLSTFCRVCLACLSREKKQLIKGCEEIRQAMLECTGVRLQVEEESHEIAVDDATTKDELYYTDSLCIRCYETLKNFIEFKALKQQTMKYLKSVVDKPENLSYDVDAEIGLGIENKIHKANIKTEASSANIVELQKGDSDNNGISDKHAAIHTETIMSLNEQNKSLVELVSNVDAISENNSIFIKDSLRDNNQLYVCSYCQKQFPRKRTLKQHIISVHEKLKPYACNICGKTFGTSTVKRRHEKTHLKEKPYSCDHCEKRYKIKADLNHHLQSHTTSPELLCPICKRAQINMEELKKHVDMHPKRQCSTCGKVFKKLSSLREHENNVHLKMGYKCNFCDLKFMAKKSLKKHELCHTSTDWPEKCGTCDLYFKSKHSLLPHIKKFHATGGADC